MIGLVVTGHGHFADGIHTSVQMIAVIAGTNLPMIVTAVTMLDMEDDPRRSITEFCEGLVICAAKSGSGHPEGHPLPLRFYVIKPCRCCRRQGSCS